MRWASIAARKSRKSLPKPLPQYLEPDARAIRALRNARELTQETLAANAGIDVKTVREIELGKLTRARGTTMTLIAKALTISLDAIVKPAVAEKATGAPEAATPATTAAPSPAGTTGSSALPRLNAVVSAEGRMAVVEDGAAISARAFQSVMSTFGLHEGWRFVVEGILIEERGVQPREAELLGAVWGKVSRYRIVVPVAEGVELKITAYAKDEPSLWALKAAYGGRVRLEVVVFVSKVDGAPCVDAFPTFDTKVPLPWAFVAVEGSVVGGAGK